ncbi:MAG: DUF11 domain-containing protein [Aquificae bacterium]|nr:DUF11 domain-containing protein [Aquificota bacterium]
MDVLTKVSKKLAAFLIVAVSAAVFAASQGPLKILLDAYKVTYEVVNGTVKEKLVPLGKEVEPGDVIEFHILAQNTSNQTLKNIYIYGKIPVGTKYVPGSASDSPEFSIDGGKTFQKPPVKYTVEVNGTKVEKIATPDMYTDIRWFVPELKPQESITFKYRVEVKK